MKKRTPAVVYYWTGVPRIPRMSESDPTVDYFVNWRLVGNQGEYLCGNGNLHHPDKASARAAINHMLMTVRALDVATLVSQGFLREVGPGRKPS